MTVLSCDLLGLYFFGWDSDTFAFVARRAFLKVVLFGIVMKVALLR